MNLSINAIIFDLDGVIIDSAPDMAQSINKTLTHFGFSSIDNSLITNFIGNGARVLLARSLATSLGYSDVLKITEVVSSDNKRMEVKNLPNDFPVNNEDFAKMLSWYIEYYKAHSIENTKLYPRVLDLLEFCKNKNIRLSVVSNKPAILSKKILSLFKIDSFFDCVIGPEDTGKTKPAPDGLALAVNLMEKTCEQKIPLTKTLMVGDSYYDIQAGKNLGCLTCGIIGGYGKIKKDTLQELSPDFYLDFAGELKEFLC